MAFYSSLFFYRPTVPPVVNGRALAEFVRTFAALGISGPGGPLMVEIKHGKGIDQDGKETLWQEPAEGIISEIREIKWDMDLSFKSIAEMTDVLASDGRTIYRARACLGPVARPIGEKIWRKNSKENTEDFTPDLWSLWMGPVTSCGLGDGPVFHVGWIAIELSGYGYLYPWTPADIVRRVESVPEICAVTELCRKTWPVVSSESETRQRNGRKRMGPLWPYPETDMPLDWYWGVSETG